MATYMRVLNTTSISIMSVSIRVQSSSSRACCTIRHEASGTSDPSRSTADIRPLSASGFFFKSFIISSASWLASLVDVRQDSNGTRGTATWSWKVQPHPEFVVLYQVPGITLYTPLQSYMALPKGGFVAEHVLILPIGHYAASTDTPQEVLDEISQFKSALRNYFKSKKQSCVIFERNFKSQHLQPQVIPLPETESGALRQAFLDHGQSIGIQLSDIPQDTPITELAHTGVPYFMVEFDEGGSLFTRIKGRFPLQFGREVLSSPLVLNVPERVDWKVCSSS